MFQNPRRAQAKFINDKEIGDLVKQTRQMTCNLFEIELEKI